MTKEQNGSKSRLKPYHIILLSCLLSTVLIKNSNMVNNNRAQNKLNQEKTELFNKIVYGRMLSETTQNANSEEVCSRASDDLKEYYETGDLGKIDLDNDAIECKDKDESYMKALIDLVKSFVGDDGDNSPDTLRNLGGDIDTDKVKEYAMRVLAMAVFLVIGFLSIFGWIVCCICSCCDCCCCCCCKKISCKVPCFIFTYIFYAFAVAVCVYGSVQTNKIFTGLANTECSFLKFFDQVLYGEMKQELPRWAGIREIRNLLSDLSSQITSLSGAHTYDTLNSKITDKNNKRDGFKDQMKVASEIFYDSNGYNQNYVRNYETLGITSYKINDEYIYDLAYQFGKYEGENQYTDNSFLYIWNMEFSTISSEADNYLSTAINGFHDVLEQNVQKVTEALEDGQNALNDLAEPFEDINNEIGGILNDYSGKIDEYGKMGVNIVFSVLMGMNIALAVLMILIYLFSMRSCAGCCCIRCLFKCCTHILWNILALMMILAFIIGSIVALVGRIGGDMMSLVSYIMSEENFNSGENALLLDKLGDARNYIRTCIHGNGDIASQLGLENSLNAFQDINSVESNIINIYQNFSQVMDQCRAYGIIETALNQRVRLETTTYMKSKTGETEVVGGVPGERNVVSDVIMLAKINELVKNKTPKRRWNISGSEELACSDDDDLPQDTFYNPKKCNPDHYEEYDDITSDYHKFTDIVNEIYYITSYAKNTGKSDSIISVITNLKTQYKDFLQEYIDILDIFRQKINEITRLVREYSGDEDLFGFINGKFIGTNLKIILKYLKYSLGEDFYIVGICLILVGCGLILSISSTILLLVIINIELKQNMGANTAATPMVPATVVSPYEPAPVIKPPQY